VLDVFWHDDALAHDTGSGVFEHPPSPLMAEEELHPENAVRVRNMKAILERGPLADDVRWRSGRHAERHELELLHHTPYIDSVREFCEASGRFLTCSTPVSKRSGPQPSAAAGSVEGALWCLRPC
jgi:acetoin utilization deacetylase AcuC-like enzyme